MNRLDALSAATRRRLAEAGLPEAVIDARRLVEAATGCDSLAMLTDGARLISDEAAQRLEGFVKRRLAGEPVGRIIGSREFYGRVFELGPATLEPRPDTECLVDLVLRHVGDGRLPGVAADGEGLAFADIGTGTGAIAVTLCAELPRATGLATDVAPEALTVARANAIRHGVASRLTLAEGSYLAPVDRRLKLIVSNPPYIETAAIAGLSREVRLFDPRLALDGGADGLDAYRALVGGCRRWLNPGGRLVVEIGADQGRDVRELFVAAGLEEVDVLADLGGRDRVVTGMAPLENP